MNNDGVRVALLVTCLVDGMMPEVGKATVRLLRRLGVDVEVPLAQTCCGQMHINTGYGAQALPLVRHHVDAFRGYDAVVVPSGSCAGSVRHQHPYLAEKSGDAVLQREVDDLAARTYELSEFLVDVLGVTDVGAYYPHRVTYHPTCHSLRVLRVGDRPLRLLREVQGLSSSTCPTPRCAAASAAPSRSRTPTSRRRCSATSCATSCRPTPRSAAPSDSSCLLHIGGGLSRTRAGVRTVHLAEILASEPV